MARLDPDLFPDRFDLDRYARRMRQQEISRVLRLVATGWHSWVRQLTGAARSAPQAGAHGLHTN